MHNMRLQIVYLAFRAAAAAIRAEILSRCMSEITQRPAFVYELGQVPMLQAT